ncbi:M10 family metallopeptidase C-terminal domain-containing protein [Paracoccus aestuariivivens]|nr:M10 family metallopeptidase C-terminal domain-containing protein [Paracoccus aestuariivivens]
MNDPQTDQSVSTSRAIRTETSDADSGISTRYTMNVGDTFVGNLATYSDNDWVRVTLTAGTYEIDLAGSGSSPVRDTYLRIYDATGTLVTYNDDGGDGLNSHLSLTVTQPGTYYVSAGAFSSSYTGSYSLNVSRGAEPTVFTIAQIAAQLTDGYWDSTDRGRRSFDVSPGETINVDLSGLDADGRRLAVAALAAWTDVSGIRFNSVNPYSGQTVHITFGDDESGAWSSSTTSGGEIWSSDVNVGRDWLDTYGTGFATYSYQTYIHEIGHALGLGHAGNYNGSAVYGTDNTYINDSWQASVMSYFSQDDNTFVNASYAYVMSAMAADIAAIQELYGRTTLRAGNTVYGENSNAGGNYGRISSILATGARDDIAFTIVDSQGVDTLNLSGDTANQRIIMTPGGISNAYGITGNIIITSGTVIENLRAGSGNDYLSGNAAHNTIWGNAGNDMIIGGLGNDTLLGGAGRDTLNGGNGNDIYHADGFDIISEGSNGGVDTVYSSGNFALTPNLENLYLTGSAQTGTGNVAANTIVGNAQGNTLRGMGGNDILNGAAGSDTMHGGAGNDTYHIDSQDRLVELANEGIDTVVSAASFTLAANFENLRLTGSAVFGTGNDAANTIVGNSLGNTIRGMAGNDILNGGGGNDRLFGGTHADTFVFGSGQDMVMDFQNNIDTLRIDDALWGGGARTVGQVLSLATVINGDTVFLFGNGNRLTIDNYTNINSLSDDLVII